MKPSQKTVKCIDWSQVVIDLEELGLSHRQIDAECGFPDTYRGTWANRLKNLPDTQPSFHDGAMLIGLWAQRMQRQPDDLPRAEYRYVRNAYGRITAIPMVDRPALLPAQAVMDSQREPEAS